MKKIFAIICLFFLFGPAVSAKVGDVSKVIKTPGPCPKGLAFDGNFLWLSDDFTDMIYKINPGDGSVVKDFEAPGFCPEGLAWDGKNLWCVDAGEKHMYLINPETGVAVSILESNSQDPRDLAWDGEYVWMVDHRRDILLKVSTVDGMMVQSFPSPAGEPAGLTFDGKYLWVTDRGRDRIYLVDPRDGLCISSFRSYGPFAYGLAWGKDILWNVDYENDEIYAVEVFSEDIFSRWDECRMSLHCIKEFRNYGPGIVETLDVYLPLPKDRDNQTLIGDISFPDGSPRIMTNMWGQKMAHFHYDGIKPFAVVKPGWKVKAKVYSTEYFIYPDRVGRLDDMPEDVKKQYTQDGDKYRINDPFIQTLARKIVGDEKNPYWIARRIFDYLGKHLSYNLKPLGGWNPAPTVLKRGTASCSEYSYCMIALCRALGVPIRYVGAFSRRGDDASYDDVYHRWTEVYLPPYGWIPFDANKGDRGEGTRPGEAVLGVGNVDARYIITTESGGGDEYLWFGYNYGFSWTARGKCRIYEETYGLWSPWGEKKYNKPLNNK
ncbi:MAG: hypothetical protein JXB26_19740 [Candidatus Aminicenantes bacterium]|nr:hypothetical protein [Candidatus Aminicenantes bacterium]